jgi:hypothetical protein
LKTPKLKNTNRFICNYKQNYIYHIQIPKHGLKLVLA